MCLVLFYVFGSDVVGVVCEVGDGVMYVKLGDCVVCGNWIGVWVEQMVVLVLQVLLLLDVLDFVMVCMVCYVYGIVYYVLVECVWLQVGEMVFISGVVGGVGLVVVDLLWNLGVMVIVGVGFCDRVEFVS